MFAQMRLQPTSNFKSCNHAAQHLLSSRNKNRLEYEHQPGKTLMKKFNNAGER